ncbi:hypothetical protein H9P43_002642 [Blastocladiella emersonii ATCC 22665]|nr:hypothetical protein H9P43_002642 [Blastocladiella emersonii ATCC 22665]
MHWRAAPSPHHHFRGSGTVDAAVQSLDGTGNNPVPAKAAWGSVGQTLSRTFVAANSYTDGVAAPRSSPNPREITRLLFDNPSALSNLTGAGYDQKWAALLPVLHRLLAIDLVQISANPAEPYPLAVPACDTVFDPLCTGTAAINYARAAGSLTGPSGSRLATNLATAYMDAGFLYGTSASTLQSMRTMTGGKLALDPKGLLLTKTLSSAVTLGELIVPAYQPVYLAGDLRINAHPGTIAITTLLAREHNRKAGLILAQNPTMSDEDVFQTARRWTISVWQRLVIEELTTTMLGSTLPGFPGYSNTTAPEVDSFSASCLLPIGYLGSGSVVYRYNADGTEHAAGHLHAPPALGRIPSFVKAVNASGIEPILIGLMTSRELPLRGGAHGNAADVLAMLVHRARDLGVPTYAAARAALGLTTPTSFASISSNPVVQATLAKIYASAADVDACLGSWLEDPVPYTRVGTTLAAAYSKTVALARNSDYFIYLSPTSGYATAQSYEVRRYGFDYLVKNNTNLARFPQSIASPADAATAFTNVTATTTISPADTAAREFAFRSRTLVDGLKLNWTVSAPYLKMQITTTLMGWIAIGFGLGMPVNMDANIVVYANGVPEVADYYTVGYGPTRDTARGGTSDISGFSWSDDPVSGARTFKWSRLLTSTDPNDANITTAGTQIVFAYGPQPAPVYHASRRGFAFINFYALGLAPVPTSTSTPTSTATATPTPTSTVTPPKTPVGLKVLHGLLMYLAFFVAIPFGIFSARHLAAKNWLDIHFKVNQFVFSKTALSLLTALLGDSNGFMDSAHGVWGMITTIGLALTMAGGMLSGFNLRVPQWVTSIARKMHVPIALATWGAGIYDCINGAEMMSKYGKEWGWFTYLNWAGLAALVPVMLYLEVRRIKYGKVAMRSLTRISKLKKSLASRSGLINDDDGHRVLPEFTWTAIREKVQDGLMWLVIDGVVYDVSKYAESHPGGKQAILRYVGSDATAAFNGMKGSASHFSLRSDDGGESDGGGDRSRTASVSGTDTSAVGLLRRRISVFTGNNNTSSGSGSANGSSSAGMMSLRAMSGVGGRSSIFWQSGTVKRVYAHAHSRLARLKLNTLAIGYLADGKSAASKKSAIMSSAALEGLDFEEGDLVPAWYPPERNPGLSELQFRSLTIVKRTRLTAPPASLLGLDATALQSPTTAASGASGPVYLFRLAFRSPSEEVWFKPGDSVVLQLPAEDGRQLHTRAYTPIACQAQGYLDLIIRVYPNGALTPLLEQLEVGDEVSVRGPDRCPKSLLRLTPAPPGRREVIGGDGDGAAAAGAMTRALVVRGLEIDPVSRGCYEHVGLIAAGTGITPMLLLIDYYVKHCPRDPASGVPLSRITLLYQAKNRGDLVYYNELEALVATHAPLLRVVYHLSQDDAGKTGGDATTPPLTPASGPVQYRRIDADAIRRDMPPAARAFRTTTSALASGPPSPLPVPHLLAGPIVSSTLGPMSLAMGGSMSSDTGGIGVVPPSPVMPHVNNGFPTIRRRTSVSFVVPTINRPASTAGGLGTDPNAIGMGILKTASLSGTATPTTTAAAAGPTTGSASVSGALSPAGGSSSILHRALTDTAGAGVAAAAAQGSAVADAMMLVCGPPEFNSSVVKALQTLGYSGDSVVVLQ